MKAKRLGLDSITVLTNQYDSETYARRGLLGLIQVLNNVNCTSILVSEDLDNVQPSRLSWVLVPGVVLLYYTQKASSMVRAIQVLKIRGTKHSEELHHLEIGDRGILVHPKERAEL
jgi:KaiC/GvpD/RAD55 family RecA-like ATPase